MSKRNTVVGTLSYTSEVSDYDVEPRSKKLSVTVTIRRKFDEVLGVDDLTIEATATDDTSTHTKTFTGDVGAEDTILMMIADLFGILGEVKITGNEVTPS